MRGRCEAGAGSGFLVAHAELSVPLPVPVMMNSTIQPNIQPRKNPVVP
ncbi:MAG: hypothetical protein ACK55I_49470 [bacterium]